MRVLGRLLAGLAVLVLIGAGAVWGFVMLLERMDAEPRAAERCTARNDGVHHPLSHEQADNAALLAAATMHRGMPARAATITIATAMQESSLRNIDHGDRDSLGLFQQRPSQGWGTPEQIMDPVYATHTFLDALEQVPGYESMAITEAAQTVQRSAFPDAYGQHEPMSRAWASALTGHSPAALVCVVHDPVPGSTATLLERVERDLGDVGARVLDGAADDDAVVALDASRLAGVEGAGRIAWGLAQWAVAIAPGHGLAEVRVADRAWRVDDGAWHVVADELAEGEVRLTLVR